MGVGTSILIATALITGLGVLMESGMRGGIAPERYATADVIISGSQSLPTEGDVPVPLVERVPLPGGLAEQISELPGVSSVAADATVQLTSRQSKIEGHPWSASSLGGFQLYEGTAPSANDEVVVTAASPAAVGDTLPFAHGGVTTEYRVVGIAKAPMESLSAEHVFFSGDRIAQLNPKDGVPPVLGIFAEDGTQDSNLAAEIAARYPDVAVQTGDAKGDAEFLESAAARSSLVAIGGALAGTCFLVTMFIVSSTLSFSVQSRRRDFALLRAIGASTAQVHHLVAREVFTVGSVAALLGLAPGYLLATTLRDAFEHAGVIPVDFTLSFSPFPAFGSVMLVLLAGWIAARAAANRPARMDPVEALREAPTDPTTIGRKRCVTGIAFGAAGLLLSTLPLVVKGQAAAGAAAGAAIILIISFALLGPVLVRIAVRGVGRVLGHLSVPVFLAMKDGTVNARRLTTAVTPLALGIALGLVQLAGPSILASEAKSQVQAGVTAQLSVSAPAGLSNEGVQEVRTTPGVASVNPIVVSKLVLDSQKANSDQPESRPELVVQGIDPHAVPLTMDLNVHEGSLAALMGEHHVALSSNAQQILGAGLGDNVEGYFGDGARLDATVVAIYERGLGFGDVTMSGQVVRSHTTFGLNEFALVATTEDVSAAASALTRAGFVVDVGGGANPAGTTGRSQQGLVSLIALIVILGYISISVVNTLMMATGQRSREFALMQLIGSSRRQIRGMMRSEAILVALLATTFGVAIALPPLVGISMAVSGHPLPQLSLFSCLMVVGAMCALALISLAVSTRSALRHPPTVEIGSRQ
ncbi:ABC transporter permease [Paenarthrobacter nicotinovorans]|uniref:ABC transporter permease n=1 Tax=Paenarthrobacter nicotinovorans TaxID=29320 RepID=UPI0024865D0D|nr:ABC transporter permease [Paenarthrobacter nicotinovorans]